MCMQMQCYFWPQVNNDFRGSVPDRWIEKSIMDELLKNLMHKLKTGCLKNLITVNEKAEWTAITFKD